MIAMLKEQGLTNIMWKCDRAQLAGDSAGLAEKGDGFSGDGLPSARSFPQSGSARLAGMTP